LVRLISPGGGIQQYVCEEQATRIGYWVLQSRETAEGQVHPSHRLVALAPTLCRLFKVSERRGGRDPQVSDRHEYGQAGLAPGDV
jgi:hypothetical protein